jgi:hypothetical protein
VNSRKFDPEFPSHSFHSTQWHSHFCFFLGTVTFLAQHRKIGESRYASESQQPSQLCVESPNDTTSLPQHDLAFKQAF